MGWALRLRAARGLGATIDPGDHAAILESGLSKADLTEIGQTISLLRKQSDSEAPRSKILQMLTDCGASQSAGDIVEAQSIVYRGQAAALMAVDCRWSGRFKEDDDDLVDRVLSQDTEEVLPAVPAGAPAQSTSAIAPFRIDQVANVPRSRSSRRRLPARLFRSSHLPSD
jgi:hypothetical protein